MLCELAVPQCQEQLFSRALLVIFTFTTESGDGKAGIMPLRFDYQMHTNPIPTN